MIQLYAVLCVAGTLLPFSQFLPWLLEHGPDLSLLLSDIVSSRIAAFAWADVLVSALALIVFIAVEGRRLAIQHLWLPVAATCCVGVSLGLPLFLLMREKQLRRTA